MDKLLCPDQLTVEERVNCRADKLAAEALVNGVANQRFISSNLLFVRHQATGEWESSHGVLKTGYHSKLRGKSCTQTVSPPEYSADS